MEHHWQVIKLTMIRFSNEGTGWMIVLRGPRGKEQGFPTTRVRRVGPDMEHAMPSPSLVTLASA